MTMQKVRLKALRNNPYVIHSAKKSRHKRRDRVSTAINQTWSIKSVPDHVRELVLERACLRAEITAITIKELSKKNPDASVLIAEKLKRIDVITNQLTNRKLHD